MVFYDIQSLDSMSGLVPKEKLKFREIVFGATKGCFSQIQKLRTEGEFTRFRLLHKNYGVCLA